VTPGAGEECGKVAASAEKYSCTEADEVTNAVNS